VLGVVKGVSVPFMLDTGAAVNLLRADIWEKVSNGETLLDWNASKLIGVEGSSIKILGVATMTIALAGAVIKGDFLIAKALTTQTILGFDFLKHM